MSGQDPDIQEVNSSINLAALLQEAELPTLPAVAQRLVEISKDDDANFARFAQVIEADPGLSSRILRVANSAYYGLRNKASTLEQAIKALGLKYVKSVALGFHLACTLNDFDCEHFNMKDFWSECLFRAVLARQLANHYCPERREEAFLVGLLQDCGIPFLVRALGERYTLLWRDSLRSQASLYKLERELFDVDHMTAAGAIMEKWGLPEILSFPIRTHHRRSQSQPSMAEEVQLCQTSYFVGTLSLNNPELICKEDMSLLQYAQSAFNLDLKALEELLQQGRDEFSRMAQLFKNVVSDQNNVAELVMQAKLLLGEIADESQKQVFDMQTEMERYKNECKVLQSKVNKFEHQAKKDRLTGLATSNMLHEFLEMLCNDSSVADSSLMVLFIDIDDFRRFNHETSRQEGDRILRLFAVLLENLFRQAGCVSRYGGDQFVVVLRGPGRRQAVKLAEALSGRLKKLAGKKKIEITCSIGMVLYEPGMIPDSPAEILEMADKQMYQVKQGGKNGLHYEIVKKATQKNHILSN